MGAGGNGKGKTMKLTDSINIVLKLLYAKKLRTFLNILGIMLGTASVISISCIGDSGTAAIISKFDKMGMNCIAIKSNISDSISVADYTYLQNIMSASAVTPIYMNYATLEYGDVSKKAVIWGVAPGFEDIYGVELASGRYFLPSDVERRRNAAIVDSAVSGAFEDFSEVTVKTKNKRVSISAVGVIKDSGDGFDSFEDSIPSFIYMPYTAVMDIYGAKGLDYISLKPSGSESIEAAGVRGVRLLERRSGLSGNYYAENMASRRSLLESVLSTIRIILGSIAAISLVIGAIGVMNIMLTSVSERTGEIGMMKAVGAARRDIMLQFLTESVIVTFIGALIGSIIGMIMGYTISAFCGFGFVFSIKKVFGTIAAICTAGLIFGVYPSKIAAGLDPAEVLR